jgi:hypothetical protein
MKIISCAECGVLIDTDRLIVPEMYDEEGCINHETASWINHDFVPVIKCPVCEGKVAFSNGNSA